MPCSNLWMLRRAAAPQTTINFKRMISVNSTLLGARSRCSAKMQSHATRLYASLCAALHLHLNFEPYSGVPLADGGDTQFAHFDAKCILWSCDLCEMESVGIEIIR